MTLFWVEPGGKNLMYVAKMMDVEEAEDEEVKGVGTEKAIPGEGEAGPEP